MEERIAPANLPMSFAVPGLVAKQGVYVAVVGQLISNYTPTNGPYAGHQLAANSWVVLATNPGDPLSKADYILADPTTTLSQSFTTSTSPQTMNVSSLFGFPTTAGSLNIFSSSGPTATVNFAGAGGSAFNGVTYAAGASQTYNAGSMVYLANQTLPLINLFPDASGIPQSNDLVTAQVSIPDGGLAPINAGQVVISVGSPMKVKVTPDGGIAAPTVQSNPYDKFGLFEWTWKSANDIDIDISEVDQVGFPFTATATNPITNISSINYGNGVATIVTATAHGLQAGDTIAISGLGNNLDGTTFVQGASSATQFTVALPPDTAQTANAGTVTLLMPSPAQDGTGMIPNRADTFNSYRDYITLVDRQNPSSNARVFVNTQANTPGSTIPIGTRITAPQDLIGAVEGTPVFVSGLGVQPIQPISGGSLPIGTSYYYAVTAVSADGESMQTQAQYSATPMGTAVLSWEPYPFATGYNVYRATSQTPFNKMQILGSGAVKLNSTPIPAPTTFVPLNAPITLPVGSITVGTSYNLGQFPAAGSLSLTAPGMPTQLLQYSSINKSTGTFTLNSALGTGTFPAGSRLTLLPTYLDTGASVGTAATPPVNNYNYDPLNSYFSIALRDFFDYYATNTFTIDMSSLSTTFSGTVSTTVVPGYTVLNLFGQAGQFGNKYAGQNVQVYLPFFSSNTNGNIPGVGSYPAAPSWLTSSITESPSQMVFGADGVFNTPPTTANPPAAEDAVKGVMNSIVSALNRGLTPIKNAQNQWTNVLPPTYWANDPNPLMGSPINSSTPLNGALSGTYYYVITAKNLNASDTVAGETTPSNLIKVNVGAGKNAALLQWKPLNFTAKANITSSNPAQQQVTLDDVSHFPNSGSFLIAIGGASHIFTYGSITPGTGTTGTLNNVVAADGTPIPATGIVYGNIGGATADSFNIYRGTTPDNLALIANVPNGTPNVSTFVDRGIATPSTPTAPPFQFYGKGSTSNYYSAFLHLQTVSINGLAYGFPYDDQGGFSTNVEMRPPAGLTITLQKWTDTTQLALALPSGPNVTAGKSFTITVQAELPDGSVDPNYAGTIHFLSSNNTALLPANYTFTKADAGQHTFTVTLARTGSATISIVDTGNSLLATIPVNVSPSSASSLSFLRAPQLGAANTAQPIAVAAEDAFGNVVTTVNGPLKVSGPFGTRIAMFKNGIAYFNLLLTQGGLFKLKLSAPFASLTSDSFGITNTTSLRIAGSNTIRVGQALQLTVTGHRPAGALDTFYAGTIDLYQGKKKIATGVASKGIARFQATFSKAGFITLVARDQKRGHVIGIKTIKVLPA